MGLVVLVVCAPVLIPLILIALFLGLFGDKLFPPKYHTTYICNQDGEILDMYEDHKRPIRQQPQAEIEYDDFDDDDDWDDDDDDWDEDDDDDDDWDDDDDDKLDEEINEIVNTKTSITFTDNKIVKAETVINNVSLDPQGYDMAAYINGKVYRFNDGEEPPEVLKMIEDTKKEARKIREKTQAMVKARNEKYAREMERLKKEEERLRRIPDGTLKSRRRDDYWDDDDDCDTIIYVDDDEFDSCNSYHEEPEPQVTSDEPMLYGGLPFGDGQIFFEDDGDAYL